MAAGALATAVLAPMAVRAQVFGVGRPGIAARPGVDEALRRTVTLVLRAEARSNGLPSFMSDPSPLTDAQAEAIVRGGPVPPGIEVHPAPDGVDRRLPHARGGSIWVAAGTWMLEVDPVRNRVLSIAPDVLPPDL